MVSKIISAVIISLIALPVQAGPKIENWQTSNGGRVYFFYAPELPMVDIQVIFDAGSARDADTPGISLLTNAMLDEGAAGLNTDQVAAEFENVGARFSNSVERDMAVLSLRTLVDDYALKPALKMFERVLTQPDFPQSSFERLQKQMLIGLKAEKQSPAAIASRAFYSALYDQHPYAMMKTGDEKSVSSLNLSTLKSFYQQYYVSSNAVVILVGAIDKKRAEIIAEQLLSKLPEGEKARDLAEVSPLTKAEEVIIEYPSSQTHIVMGQPGISRDDPDYFPLYVGNHILGGSGLVSRLSDEVREKRGLSYSTYSYFNPMRQRGPYRFGLQTRNDQADEALQVMRETLGSFIEDGPTQAELEAAKKNITGGFALRINSNSKIAGYLAVIGFYDLPLDYLDKFKSRISAVTIEQIKDAYNRRVDQDTMATVMVGGKK